MGIYISDAPPPALVLRPGGTTADRVVATLPDLPPLDPQPQTTLTDLIVGVGGALAAGFMLFAIFTRDP